MNNDREQLSPAGTQRREQMLAELTGQMRTIHHRRRTRRSLVLAGCVVITGASIVGAIWLVSVDHRARAVEQLVNGTDVSKPLVVEQESQEIVVVRMIQTDPTIVERWRAHPTQQCVMVDDDELLDDLAAADKHAGLIRSQGRVWLTQDVATPTPGANAPAIDSSSSAIQSSRVARAMSRSAPRG